jgi:hypothetical protein
MASSIAAPGKPPFADWNVDVEVVAGSEKVSSAPA